MKRVIEVDEGDHLMAEENLTTGVAEIDLTQGDGESAQGLADAKVASAIGKPTLGLHLAHLETGRVLDRRQVLGKIGIGLGRRNWRE